MNGLRLLPWVGKYRDEGEDNNQLECTHCLAHLPEPQRARWGCGFLPPSKRLDRLRGQLPFFDHVAECDDPSCKGCEATDVCPGWLIRLPGVLEAARAYGWRHDLRDFYGGLPPTQLLLDCIDIFAYGVETVKSAPAKEAMESAKRVR